MKRFALIACVLVAGCASTPGRFQVGDIATAQNWRDIERNGERVTITGALAHRWIRGGNTLRVYEVRTSDGLVFAAQEFQLRSDRAE